MSEVTERYQAIVVAVCRRSELPVPLWVRNRVLLAAHSEYVRSISYSGADMAWLAVIWEKMQSKALDIIMQYNDCQLKGLDIERKYRRMANGHSDCMMGELIPQASYSSDRDAFWNDVATLSGFIHQELVQACQ